MAPATKSSKKKGEANNVDNPSLTQELRNVIERMGPNSPQLQDISEIASTSDNDTENDKPKKFYDETILNTPKDYSDLTSFATDTVDVYVDPKTHHTTPTNNARVINMPFNNVCNDIGPTISMQKLANFLKPKAKETKSGLDLYKINILQPKNDTSPPKRVIFDLVENVPKPFCSHDCINPYTCSVTEKPCPNHMTRHNIYHPRIMQDKSCHGKESKMQTPSINGFPDHEISTQPGFVQKHVFTNTNANKPLNMHATNSPYDLKNMARVDVYYFDHGNSAYFQTTDAPPILMTEILAEKTESYTTAIWAQLFGSIHIGFAFITSFVLQFFRFVLQSLVRPLTIGLAQIGSDYFLKPILATLFNAFIQPILILIYNVATSLRDICDPIAEGMGYFIREIAVIFRAIRLIDYRNESKCKCNKSIKNKCSVKETCCTEQIGTTCDEPVKLCPC